MSDFIECANRSEFDEEFSGATSLTNDLGETELPRLSRRGLLLAGGLSATAAFFWPGVCQAQFEVRPIELPLARVSLDEKGDAPDEISNDRWLEIEALVPQTGLTREDFSQLVGERTKTFLSYQVSASAAVARLDDKDRRDAQTQAEADFKTAALRFRLTKKLISEEKPK